MNSKKKRGRPARYFLGTDNSEDLARAKKNLEIATAVYKAVYEGKPYRDGIEDHGALSVGVKKAEELGINLSQDGVEALIERLIKDPESLFKVLPTQSRDTLTKVLSGFLPNQSVLVTTGQRVRRIGPNTEIRGTGKIPVGDDKGAPEATLEPNGSQLKIRKNRPGT